MLHRRTLQRLFLLVRRRGPYFRLNDMSNSAKGDQDKRESMSLDEDVNGNGDGNGEEVVFEFESAFDDDSFGSDLDSDSVVESEEYGEEIYQHMRRDVGDADDDSVSEASTLSKYFDPYTSILREEVLEPSVPTATWERRMNRRIQYGTGLSAWIDWVVDKSVGWVRKATDS